MLSNSVQVARKGDIQKAEKWVVERAETLFSGALKPDNEKVIQIIRDDIKNGKLDQIGIRNHDDEGRAQLLNHLNQSISSLVAQGKGCLLLLALPLAFIACAVLVVFITR